MHTIIVGTGSAGRRHATALRSRLPTAPITIVRRPDSASPPVDLAGPVTVVPDLDLALAQGPAAGPICAVVASPATSHTRHVLSLLDAGATVLVEKPLAATTDDARRLANHPGAATRLLVGYHLRWLPLVADLVAMVSSGAVGVPEQCHFEVGQHLDDWRPGMVTTRSVSARADLGGGVLLELSHELDAIRYLLGEVTTVSARLGFDGAPTDGIVETIADLTLHLASGASGTVHLDMVAPTPRRTWRIEGTAATIEADLLAGTIDLHPRSGASQRLPSHGSGAEQRTRAEADLIDHLLAVHAGAAAPACTADDGLTAVMIAMAATRSHQTNQPVALTTMSPIMNTTGPPP